MLDGLDEEKEITIPPHRAWARLIRRIYEVDQLVCTSCGGEMRIVSVILEHKVINRILGHLGWVPGFRILGSSWMGGTVLALINAKRKWPPALRTWGQRVTSRSD